MVNSGLKGLRNDMALHPISQSVIPNIIQILFICPGCAHVSFISRFGKTTSKKFYCDYVLSYTTDSCQMQHTFLEM